MLSINTREPKFAGDFKAMVGALNVGKRRLDELTHKYSVKTVKDCMNYIVDYTERRFRAEIASWPDGVYHGEGYLEHDCQGTKDITVRCTVTVKGDSLKLDFTGSDPQTMGFINSPIANDYSFIFLTLSSMIDDSIPRNEGLFRPLEVILPAGTVVNPNPPAAVTACTLHIGGEVGEAVAMALAQAIPEKAFLQNVKMGMPVVTYGISPDVGEFYLDQNTNMSAGWCGAAYGTDGWGSLPCYFGSMIMATAELHEMYYPWLTLEREFMTDSGGPGQWRGGVATRVRQKAVAQMWAHTFLIGTKYTMRGIAGGKDGPPNKTVLKEGNQDEMMIETAGYGVPLSENDVLMVEFGGGGGWGDPLNRDPNMVLQDVLDEYVSVERASKDYGVVIDKDKNSIDIKATNELRKKLRQEKNK
jgi:N-methylhydantoinase B